MSTRTKVSVSTDKLFFCLLDWTYTRLITKKSVSRSGLLWIGKKGSSLLSRYEIQSLFNKLLPYLHLFIKALFCRKASECSFKNSITKSGPTKEPWLTPMYIGVDLKSFRPTYTVRYTSFHRTVISTRLKHFIFAKRYQWSTESKVFVISR